MVVQLHVKTTKIIMNLTELELMSVLLQVALQSSILLNLKCHFLKFDEWIRKEALLL